VSAKRKPTTPRESGAVPVTPAPEDESFSIEEFIDRTDKKAQAILDSAGWQRGMPLDDARLRDAHLIVVSTGLAKKLMRVSRDDAERQRIGDAVWAGFNLGLDLYAAEVREPMEWVTSFRGRGRLKGAIGDATKTFREVAVRYPDEDSGQLWTRISNLPGWWEEDGRLMHKDYVGIDRGSFRTAIHRIRSRLKT
jgi:hypothetical protein